MVERIIKDLRLSDLKGNVQRETKCMFYMDENSGPNSIDEFKIRKNQLQNKVVRTDNRCNLPLISNVKDEQYQRYNNLNESRLPQPYKDYESDINPLSHFKTTDYAVKVKTEAETEHTPTNADPSTIHSKRHNCPNVFEEINRESEADPRQLLYNSRQKPTTACKAALRMAERKKLLKDLSIQDNTQQSTFLSNVFPTFNPKIHNPIGDNDKKALKYMYTSTTQKAYEDIPFDNYLHPRRWPPVSSLENCADPLRRTKYVNATYPCVNDWGKKVDLNVFERDQIRPNHNLQPRPHDFCAPMKRAGQIPSYSGCIGSSNKDLIDNPYVSPFEPYTIRRGSIPKFADCVERPVFVGYAGNIPYLPANLKPPFHTDSIVRDVLGTPC